jgi:hypothetical protein
MQHQMVVFRQALANLLLRLAFMAKPNHRNQTVDYTITSLPDEILAIIRTTWYDGDHADNVDEVVLMEDGQRGYDAFDEIVSAGLIGGANISIQSAYNPQDLGIEP